MAVFQTTWRLDPNILNLEYIKRFIPLVLDLEKAEYSYWSYLFRVTARAHNLLHHIDSTIPAPSDIDASDWAQLDAIVLHWIHSTISTDLLVAILNEKSTAMDTWTGLRDLFQHSNNSNTHQNSLPQTLNLLSSYVEQQPGKKRKLPLYTSSIYGHRPNSSVLKAAQVRAICSHQHLQTVEYVGYAGCTSSSKLALFLTQHAPMLNKFIFYPHQPQVVGKPETHVYGSEFCDKVAIARRHAEQLAKQIRGGVDVVIL